MVVLLRPSLIRHKIKEFMIMDFRPKYDEIRINSLPTIPCHLSVFFHLKMEACSSDVRSKRDQVQSINPSFILVQC